MKRLVGVLLLALAGCNSRSGPSVAELAKRTSAADPTALSSEAIANSELPPEGTRSLFDHLMAQSDGVPYPFEKLLATLQKLHPEGKAPLALLVPDGRSLLKAQANYAHPRIVAALDFEGAATPASLGLAPKGQLFLGFTELANEIEVISYNEAAGRFEFQLVQDYQAKGARKLVYAKRAICESCHQGSAPIFSQRPWNETNGQPETAAKIADTLKADGKDATRYLSLPVSVPLATPERIDELTDVGNFIATTQKLWIDGCGDGEQGAACRRLMLRLALRHARAPGDFSPHGTDVSALIALQQAQARAGKTIAEPQSDLANRDPIGETKGFKGWLRGMFKPTVTLGDGAKTNEDLEAFDKLPKLPAVQDPLTSRPPKRQLGASDIDGIYGLSSLFTTADLRLLASAAGRDWATVEQAVQRLPADFFAARPFGRVKTLQALLPLLAPAQALPAYCCLDTADMSPPIASGEPPVALATHSPIAPFAEHCFACHRGNPAKRLNFMSGKTEAEVTEHIKAKTEIRDALDWPRYAGTDKASTLMPPADSVQRAELEAQLKSQPKLLEQMRDVVPGLFDF